MALVIAALIVVFIGPISRTAARQFDRELGANRDTGASVARWIYLSFAGLLVLFALLRFKD